MKSINLQPTLTGKQMHLRPLIESDFNKLYSVASDPLIWELHPENTRYLKNVFLNFFQQAILSCGALLIVDSLGEVAGSSRYYDYNKKDNSVAIGYTFIARKYWGGSFNRELKTLMLNHAFTFAGTVFFHIGINNYRSWKAIEKIGAVRSGTTPSHIPGQDNYIYKINRINWQKIEC